MVLTVVPVAAMTSGRSMPAAALLLLPVALLSTDALRHAAFTLDMTTLVAPVCAVAAMVGALAWRPMARAITDAQV